MANTMYRSSESSFGFTTFGVRLFMYILINLKYASGMKRAWIRNSIAGCSWEVFYERQ